MSNQEKDRKGMGEVNVFNYEDSKDGLYIGTKTSGGVISLGGFKKSNISEKHIELGYLGECKKVVFGEPKCEI